MSRSYDSAAVDFNRLLETSDIEVDTSTLVEIDRGFSSTVYGNDDKVVKILSAVHPTWRSAEDQAEILYAEQEEIRRFLKPCNMAVAHFVVGQTTEGDHKISLVQDRIQGLTITEALEIPRARSPIITYFSQSLKMHRYTKRIPDLACLEKGFNPLEDTNTQVIIEGDDATPVLVDTILGRTQRRPHMGKLIHNGIAWGVRRALKQLE